MSTNNARFSNVKLMYLVVMYMYKHCSSNLQTAGNPMNVFGKKRQIRSTLLLNRTCCDSDFCNDGKDTTSTTVTKQNVVNQFGKEFFLSFPSTSQNIDKIEVILTGMSDTTVTFESQVNGVNRTVIVPANKGLSVFLPLDLLHIYNGTKTVITHNMVKVKSVTDITIFVVLYGKGYTSDGYLVLPKQTLGRVYSFDVAACMLAITATEVNTSVLISVFETVQNNSGKTNYTFIVSIGQILYVYLETEVVVFIESHKDIDVVATIYHDFRQYMEGALPLQSPSSYALAPLQNDDMRVGCLSAEKSKNLYFSRQPEKLYSVNMNMYAFDFNYSSPPLIASTNGSMNCLGASTEGGFVSFQPLSSFTNYYLFKTPTSTNYTHVATISTPTQYKDGILDNGNHLSIINQFEVQFNNTEYTVMWLNITDGVHHFVHADRQVKFGLTLYGYSVSKDDVHVAYAYPAGFERKIHNHVT